MTIRACRRDGAVFVGSLILVASAVLAGCASSSTASPVASVAPTSAGVASAPPAATPAAPSPTIPPVGASAAAEPPTTAPATPASATAPSPATAGYWPFRATFCPESSRPHLRLVALGTSETAGYGMSPDEPWSPQLAYPGRYAGILCRELGRPVELHSYFPSQSYNEFATVSWWNERFTGDATLRDDLGGADIVVMWPLGVHDAIQPLFFGTCGSAWPDPMKACVEKIAAGIRTGTDADFATIASLVPEGAKVLAADAYLPPALVDRWASRPFWPELRALIDPWATLPALAEKHGFTFVDTELAFNGPDHSAMPADGLFQPDGLHPLEAGALKVAELFAEADGLGH